MLVMGRESSIPERNIIIIDNFSISVNLLQIKFIYARIMFISMNLFAFDVLLDFILKKIHAIGKITVFFFVGGSGNGIGNISSSSLSSLDSDDLLK